MNMYLRINTIRKLMAKNRLTQKALATLVGMHPQNISKILQRGTCSLKTGGLLADALGVEIEEIWREE